MSSKGYALIHIIGAAIATPIYADIEEIWEENLCRYEDSSVQYAYVTETRKSASNTAAIETITYIMSQRTAIQSFSKRSGFFYNNSSLRFEYMATQS